MKKRKEKKKERDEKMKEKRKWKMKRKKMKRKSVLYLWVQDWDQFCDALNPGGHFYFLFFIIRLKFNIKQSFYYKGI